MTDDPQTPQTPLTREQSRMVRERQQSRANMLAFVLAGLAVLFFAITIVKLGVT